MPSYQEEVYQVIADLLNEDRRMTINRTLIEYMDCDVLAALFLNQVIYWADRTKRKDGFFYKSYEEWESEIYASKYQIRKYTEFLTKKGVLETVVKKADGSPTVHYKIKRTEFVDSIRKFLNNGSSNNLTIQSKETSRSLTESTTQNTTEKKKPQTKFFETEVQEVFDHWLDKTAPYFKQSPRFTATRKKKVIARLESGYSVDNIKQAIDYVTSSPFHTGKNDTGKLHIDLELICRSDEKLEGYFNNTAQSNNQDSSDHGFNKFHTGGQP